MVKEHPPLKSLMTYFCKVSCGVFANTEYLYDKYTAVECSFPQIGQNISQRGILPLMR